jgi:hypothetical protein
VIAPRLVFDPPQGEADVGGADQLGEDLDLERVVAGGQATEHVGDRCARGRSHAVVERLDLAIAGNVAKQQTRGVRMLLKVGEPVIQRAVDLRGRIVGIGDCGAYPREQVVAVAREQRQVQLPLGGHVLVEQLLGHPARRTIYRSVVAA